MLASKKGQASTYSPNTQSLNRRRLGNLFAAPAPSPLASSVGSVDGEHDHQSPTKSSQRSVLGRLSLLTGGGTGGPSTGEDTEDEGCFVLRANSPAAQVDHAGPAHGAQANEGAESLDAPASLNLMSLPDEVLSKIVSHLPLSARQLLLLGRIDHRFADLTMANRFWKELYDQTPAFALTANAARRAEPSFAAPPGVWTSKGWVWTEQDVPATGGDHVEMAENIARSAHRAASEDGADEEEDIRDSSVTDTFRVISPSKTPSKPIAHRSRKAPIPIHYPTLFRSRVTLSRLLRDPSHLHRQSFETLSRHSDSVYCLNAVGRWLITGSRDRSIRLWRLGAFDSRGQSRQTRLIKTLHNAHEGSVLAVQFDLDEATGRGTLVAGSSDTRASVWDLDFSPEKRQVDESRTFGTPATGRGGNGTRAPTITRRETLQGHTAGVLDVVLTPGYIVTSSMCCKGIKPLSTASQAGESASGPRDAEQAVSASADGSWIVWDLSSGTEIRRHKEGDSGLACVAWQGDYIVTGDTDRLVKVFNANTAELLRTFKGHTDLVRTINIDLDEGIVVSGSYDKSIMHNVDLQEKLTIEIWDLHTGELLRKITTQHTSLVFDLQYTATRLISASHDRSIQVVSLATGLPYLDLMA